MDDLTLFGKNEDQLDSLVKTVHLVSKDPDFPIKTFGILFLQRGKIYYCEGITLLDRQIMRKIKIIGTDILVLLG